MRRYFQRTTRLSVLFLGIVLGIWLSKVISIEWILIPLLVGVLAVSWRLGSYITLGACLMLGIAIGIYRGGVTNQKIAIYQTLYGQEVEVVGIVSTDAVYGDKSQLEFDVSKLELQQPYEQSLLGTLQVRGFEEVSVVRGDKIRVQGKLYPAGGSRVGRISFAETEIVTRSASIIEYIKHRFSAGIHSALPEPMGSFGLGLLLGQRSAMPEQTQDVLRTAGLAHLVAVSGYNLTVLVRLARRVSSKRSRYQALLISLTLISIFLLLTGFSASIVRAAIVSTLSVLAVYYGRRIKPAVLLLFTAAITGFWNPIYVWDDIGWYLSFLAFFGVLIVSPLILIRLKATKNAFVQLIVESFSAQLMTIPLVVLLFKEFSVVGLLANVLTVPAVPFAMLTSLVAGLAGMIVPQIAGILALPAKILLTYMLDIANILAGLPYASAEVAIDSLTMFMLYTVIGVLCAGLYKHARTHHAKIADVETV